MRASFVLVLLLAACGADSVRQSEVRLWRRSDGATAALVGKTTGFATVGTDGLVQSATLLARTDCAAGFIIGELDDGSALDDRRVDVALWRADGSVSRVATDIGRVTVATFAGDGGTLCLRSGASAESAGSAMVLRALDGGGVETLAAKVDGVVGCVALRDGALLDVDDGGRHSLSAVRVGAEAARVATSSGAFLIVPAGDRRSAAVLSNLDYTELTAEMGAVRFDGAATYTTPGDGAKVLPWPTVDETGTIVYVTREAAEVAGPVHVWTPGQEPREIPGVSASVAWSAMAATVESAAVFGALVDCKIAAASDAIPSLDGHCDLARLIDGEIPTITATGLGAVKARWSSSRQVVVTGFDPTTGLGTGVAAVDLGAGEQVAQEAPGALSGYLTSATALLPFNVMTGPFTDHGLPVTPVAAAGELPTTPDFYVTQLRGHLGPDQETRSVAHVGVTSVFISAPDAESGRLVISDVVLSGALHDAADYTTPIESRADISGLVQCVLYAAYVDR